MSSKKSLRANLALTGSLIACALTFSQQASALPAGWTFVGNAGDGVPNGVVTAAPAPYGPNYIYITTEGGANGAGQIAGATWTGTTGTTLTSSLFSAAAGDALNFNFNFVTSDGSGFPDYAWARLLDSAQNEVALLFTATTFPPPTSTVPGNGLPAPSPGVTLNPASIPIINGDGTPGGGSGPVWSELGGSSGTCYLGIGQGCGYTDWVNSSYTIASAGDYYLQFGVTNAEDEFFQSGMAISGATIGGKPIENPEPAGLALFGIGLAGLLAHRRRKNLA